MKFSFVRTSQNRKIGPMPAVIAPRVTCPDTCALKGAGCYAEHGMMGMAWKRVNDGTAPSLLDFAGLCDKIRELPRKIRWRYGTAGDLPPDLPALVAANAGREVIAYTHGRDFDAYRAATAAGFHINLSADSPAQVDELPADMSVVVVLPEGQRRPSYTPGGRKIAVCPAAYSDRVSCSTCNLCCRPRPGGVVVGFPAHGTRKRMVTNRINQQA